MAILTALPLVEAQQILTAYGISCTQILPLAAGSVNSNFLIESTTGRFFARIYEEQGPDGAAFELLLNERLAQAGVSVAQPVRRLDGGLASLAKGKPFAVYQLLSGGSPCQKMVNPEMTYQLGQSLARVHTAELGGLAIPPSRFDFRGLEERLERVRISKRASLLGDVEILGALSQELRAKRSTELPSGLIHGDLFRDNVLLEGSRIVALLDFESASFGPYLYDLLVTLLAWCYGEGLDQELSLAMVKGYESARPLTPLEVGQVDVEASVVCLRFATTRLTDFSLRVAEGEAPVRDYRRFLARLAEVQAGALRQVFASR